MRGYGNVTRAEMAALRVRAFFRLDRNKAIVANAILYAAGFGLIALVVIPR